MRHTLFNVERPERQQRATNSRERLRFSTGVNVGLYIDVGIAVGAASGVGPLEPRSVNKRLRFQSRTHQVDQCLTRYVRHILSQILSRKSAVFILHTRHTNNGFQVHCPLMPTVRFLATRDGKTAIFSAPLDLTPEQTSLQGLRETFFERTGRQTFVLHDGGLGLNLAKDSYLVRLEGDVSDAADTHPPLEHARARQQPGWFGETLVWLETTLGETVWAEEQVGTNDLACVLRAKTERRTVYLKASETGLEAALSAHLATRHPELTPNVVAWDEPRRLLVTADCGVHVSENADPEVWHAAVTKLARFQRTVDAHAFQALGCPVHTFTDLADRAETFLHDAATLFSWGLTATQVAALSERAPHIQRAHERVLALELPLLPAHGDAHPMNAITGCGGVWFDWSEACAAHPLLESGWFLAWLTHPARGTLPLRRTRPDAATELWQTYLQASGLPEAVSLNDAMTLALIHRALAYHERFRTRQGTVPDWQPEYVPYYLRCLLKHLL